MGRTCELCSPEASKPATVYCSADVCFLCTECDTEVHSANRLARRHVRRPVVANELEDASSINDDSDARVPDVSVTNTNKSNNSNNNTSKNSTTLDVATKTNSSDIPSLPSSLSSPSSPSLPSSPSSPSTTAHHHDQYDTDLSDHASPPRGSGAGNSDLPTLNDVSVSFEDAAEYDFCFETLGARMPPLTAEDDDGGATAALFSDGKLSKSFYADLSWDSVVSEAFEHVVPDVSTANNSRTPACPIPTIAVVASPGASASSHIRHIKPENTKVELDVILNLDDHLNSPIQQQHPASNPDDTMSDVGTEQTSTVVKEEPPKLVVKQENIIVDHKVLLSSKEKKSGVPLIKKVKDADVPVPVPVPADVPVKMEDVVEAATAKATSAAAAEAVAAAATTAAVVSKTQSPASTAITTKGSAGSGKKPGDDNKQPDSSREADEAKVLEQRKKRRMEALARFRSKRANRSFTKKVRYECRKQLADSRPRVKGRFVRKVEMALFRKYGAMYREHLDELKTTGKEQCVPTL